MTCDDAVSPSSTPGGIDGLQGLLEVEECHLHHKQSEKLVFSANKHILI